MFQGFTFKITCIPFDIRVDAVVNTSSTNPRKFYKDHKGYEVMMIEDICKVRD